MATTTRAAVLNEAMTDAERYYRIQHLPAKVADRRSASAPLAVDVAGVDPESYDLVTLSHHLVAGRVVLRVGA